MLFLLFELGHNHYALDAGQVVEVLPLVRIKHLPQAPAGVAGLVDYRGAPVPVVDLSELMLGRPAASQLSTRLVLVRYPDANGHDRLLGLIAERATDTLRREPADFVPSGIASGDASYLGPVATDPRGLIQRVDITNLLPQTVRELLFTESADR